MSSDTIYNLSPLECFSVLYKYIWTQEATDRLLVNIPHTIIFSQGHPYRWLFTSKEGEILRKKDDKLSSSSSVATILSAFKQYKSSNKGFIPPEYKNMLAIVWYTEDNNNLKSILVEEEELKLILTRTFLEIIGVQAYSGQHSLKGTGVFECVYKESLSSLLSSTLNLIKKEDQLLLNKKKSSKTITNNNNILTTSNSKEINSLCFTYEYNDLINTLEEHLNSENEKKNNNIKNNLKRMDTFSSSSSVSIVDSSNISPYSIDFPTIKELSSNSNNSSETSAQLDSTLGQKLIETDNLEGDKIAPISFLPPYLNNILKDLTLYIKNYLEKYFQFTIVKIRLQFSYIKSIIPSMINFNSNYFYPSLINLRELRIIKSSKLNNNKVFDQLIFPFGNRPIIRNISSTVSSSSTISNNNFSKTNNFLSLINSKRKKSATLSYNNSEIVGLDHTQPLFSSNTSSAPISSIKHNSNNTNIENKRDGKNDSLAIPLANRSLPPTYFKPNIDDLSNPFHFIPPSNGIQDEIKPHISIVEYAMGYSKNNVNIKSKSKIQTATNNFLTEKTNNDLSKKKLKNLIHTYEGFKEEKVNDKNYLSVTDSALLNHNNIVIKQNHLQKTSLVDLKSTKTIPLNNINDSEDSEVKEKQKDYHYPSYKFADEYYEYRDNEVGQGAGKGREANEKLLRFLPVRRPIETPYRRNEPKIKKKDETNIIKKDEKVIENMINNMKEVSYKSVIKNRQGTTCSGDFCYFLKKVSVILEEGEKKRKNLNNKNNNDNSKILSNSSDLSSSDCPYTISYKSILLMRKEVEFIGEPLEAGLEDPLLSLRLLDDVCIPGLSESKNKNQNKQSISNSDIPTSSTTFSPPRLSRSSTTYTLISNTSPTKAQLNKKLSNNLNNIVGLQSQHSSDYDSQPVLLLNYFIKRHMTKLFYKSFTEARALSFTLPSQNPLSSSALKFTKTPSSFVNNDKKSKIRPSSASASIVTSTSFLSTNPKTRRSSSALNIPININFLQSSNAMTSNEIFTDLPIRDTYIRRVYDSTLENLSIARAYETCRVCSTCLKIYQLLDQNRQLLFLENPYPLIQNVEELIMPDVLSTIISSSINTVSSPLKSRPKSASNLSSRPSSSSFNRHINAINNSKDLEYDSQFFKKSLNNSKINSISNSIPSLALREEDEDANSTIFIDDDLTPRTSRSTPRITLSLTGNVEVNLENPKKVTYRQPDSPSNLNLTKSNSQPVIPTNQIITIPMKSTLTKSSSDKLLNIPKYPLRKSKSDSKISIVSDSSSQISSSRLENFSDQTFEQDTELFDEAPVYNIYETI